MLNYILRRLMLIPVTLLGVMAVNFFIIQLAPGGPVETLIARMEGIEFDLSERFAPTGSGDDGVASAPSDPRMASEAPDLDGYRGRQGIDDVTLAKSFKCFDFSQHPLVMFANMVWDYVRLDFCESFFRDDSIFTMIAEVLPVSITLGVFGALFTYSICIPLGIWKSRRDGSHADNWTTTALISIDAIPSFLVAILALTILGTKFGWFPIGGLVSRGWEDFPLWRKIIDYLHHITLPVIVILVGGYSVLTMLVKNSFLDHLNQPYVTTARAKGLSEGQIMRNHVFRNAMIIVIAGIPAAFIGLFLGGSVLIEKIFSIRGLGLMGLDALARRDFPVLFGTLFLFSLLGLLIQLISDIVYTIVDPRIDFEGR